MGGERETTAPTKKGKEKKKKRSSSLSLSLSPLCFSSIGRRFESIDHASRPPIDAWTMPSKLDPLLLHRESRPPTRKRRMRCARTYVETQFVNEDARFCSTNRIPFRCTYARRGQQNTGNRAPGPARSSDYRACLSSQPPTTSTTTTTIAATSFRFPLFFLLLVLVPGQTPARQYPFELVDTAESQTQ